MMAKRKQDCVRRSRFILLGLALFFLCQYFVRLYSNPLEKRCAARKTWIPVGFRYEYVVVIVAFDRYEYFQLALRSLIGAEGSQCYTLVVALDGLPEGAREEVVAAHSKIYDLSISIKEKALFKQVVVDTSSTNLGVWKNKKRGVALAFEFSDFVIILEDDITISSDGLRWFEWHVESGLIFKHKDIATASCWSTSFAASQGSTTWDYDISMARELQLHSRWIKSSWAHQWGWATWRSTWDEFGEGWTGQDQNLARTIQAKGLYETHPLLARCNNIGSFGVNKRGQHEGHVHLRSITSGDMAVHKSMIYNRPLCWPVQLKDQTLHHLQPEEVYGWLRGGMGHHNATSSTSFATVRQRVQKVREAHQSWAQLSSC